MRFPFASVVWKTLEADIRFSMYWPRTWFSDFNLRFSSFTASTLADRSGGKEKTGHFNVAVFQGITQSLYEMMCDNLDKLRLPVGDIYLQACAAVPKPGLLASSSLPLPPGSLLK